MLTRGLVHLFLIVFLFASVVAKPKIRKFDRHLSDHEVSKESIIENRNRRKHHLEMMILDARKKLADHSAGTARLDEKEKDDLERRIDLFQRKVDDLSKEMDSREWEMILRREHRHAERRRRRHEEL